MPNILLSRGFKGAIIISSSIFTITHTLQLLSGQSFEDTILQVIYAFFIGMGGSFFIIREQTINYHSTSFSRFKQLFVK